MPTHTLTVPGFVPTPLNRLMRGRRRGRVRLARQTAIVLEDLAGSPRARSAATSSAEATRRPPG
jgi:hypothetical protein